MKKFILLLAVCLLTGCVVESYNLRRIEIKKDANGKIISTTYIEEQVQQQPRRPFYFKELKDDD